MADASGAAAAAAESAAQNGSTSTSNDLLPKMIPFFDRHLVFPLLEFIATQESDASSNESSSEITKTKYELLKHTNMTDYVASLWQEINDTDKVPDEFVKKREDVLSQLEKYGEDSAKVTDLLQNQDVTSNLRSDKVQNLQFLKDNYQV
jgi:translation initiation factor 3 subunit E